MSNVIGELPPHYRYAMSQIGVKEIAGRQHNPAIVGYAHSIGLTKINDDETAWCATFVGACLERCGIRSTRTAWARDYLNWGVKLDVPYTGCIVVFDRGGGYGHVGFFVRREGNRVLVLGGNQKNQVCYQWYDLSAFPLLGYRAPADAPTPEIAEPEPDPVEPEAVVDPEPTTPPTPETSRPPRQRDVAEQGSRSMSWLQWLQIKLGIGAGGFGIYEITYFFKGAKGVLHDFNQVIVDNAPLLLGVFLVACLVSAIMAGIRLLDAYKDGRYDPSKPSEPNAVLA